MGLSINTYTYVSGVTDYDLNFALGYASRSDVAAYVNGETPVDIQFDFLTENRVRIDDSGLEDGDEISFTRTVDKTSLPVDLTAAGEATRDNIELCFRHTMYIQHEVLDGRISDLVDFDSIIYEQVEAAVQAALENFVFWAKYKYERELRIDLTSSYNLGYTIGEALVDTAEAGIFIENNPDTTVEVLVYHNGSVILGFTVSPTGVVTVTNSTEVLTVSGPYVVEEASSNYSSGLVAAIVLPYINEASVSFDKAIGDYVQIFEDARNT